MEIVGKEFILELPDKIMLVPTINSYTLLMVIFIFIICFGIYDYLFQNKRPLFYTVLKIHIAKPPQGHSGTVN